MILEKKLILLIDVYNLIVLFIFWFADFDDMSCEMIFGQEPPASIDDTALKQPCYKLCNYFYARLITFIYDHVIMKPSCFYFGLPSVMMI